MTESRKTDYGGDLRLEEYAGDDWSRRYLYKILEPPGAGYG